MICTKRYYFLLLLVLFLTACNDKKKPGDNSMPGMRMPDADHAKALASNKELDTNSLKDLLHPTTEFVVAALPVTSLQSSAEPMELHALGSVEYDNRQVHSISSRISGRIEKLYVRYRFQHVNKGQKVLEIYSPELVTGQQNLIFLLRNDASNKSLINAAQQRLLLQGMSAQQLAEISQTGKPLYRVAVYSAYAGYVTEPGFSESKDNIADKNIPQNNTGLKPASTPNTFELSVKEGMYIQKAQPVFTLINANLGRVSFNAFADQEHLLKRGLPVMIVPETSPGKRFRSTIERVEPFFSAGSKTVSARVYFDNATLQLPIGSQVQVTIFVPPQKINWLPASAVINTGLNNVVFKKEGNGFVPQAVTIGIRNNDKVQILSGLTAKDSVAINAQHLTESESIIKVKQ